MHNVVEKLRNRKLNSTAKILRDNGLEGDDGIMTGAGLKVMLDELWEEKREAIAKLLTDLEAAEAKEQ